MFPTEQELDRLLLGPDSVAWRATSDLRLNFAILYPLLLQVAHPTVDAGVTDYSDFDQKPWDLGPRHGARHYVRGHAHFGTPMSAADTERFYGEYRGLGRLIGVREGDLPETWPRFCAYFRRTARTTLTRTASIERVLDTIAHVDAPPTPISGRLWPALKVPIRRAVWLGGVGLLEPAVRRRLGLHWTPIDAAQLRVLGAVSRGLGPVMPAAWKVTGPEHLRWRSAEIEAGPLGRAV